MFFLESHYVACILITSIRETVIKTHQMNCLKIVMQHYTHLINGKASVQLMYITQDDEEKKENFLKNKMEGRKQKRRVM